MNRTLSAVPLALALLLALAEPGHAAKSKKGQPAEPVPSAPAGPTTFAPLPEGHELASLWNDPDFARRLTGSYGLLSDLEPRLQPEEQQFLNEKLKPLLQQNRTNAIPELLARIKPESSAQFDFLLGTIYFETEDLTNAVKHFEAALAKFPDFRRAQKNLAFALVRNGQYADALKPLTRTLTLGGADGKVLGLLGFAYLNQGRPVSAEAAYRQALVFEPDNLDLKLGLVRSAVASANYDAALALLDELLKQYPERDTLWTLQANLYIQKEQTAKAAISLEMLRRLGKATPANLYLLGDLYMTQDSRDLAMDAYRQALEKDGGQNVAKALRAAQILVSRGAWPEARTLFQGIRSQAGANLAGDNELKLLKLEAKAAISTGSGEEAIKVLEQLIVRNPLDGEALLMAGDYYARNGQKEKAEFRYDTAAKLQGFEADALLKQAQLHVQGRKYSQATELLKKAQKLNPRDNVQRYLEKVEQLARAGQS